MTITTVVQQPLDSIDGLYDYDEAHGRLIVSSYTEDRLNRYVFTWYRTPEDDVQASSLVHHILREYKHGAWLLARELVHSQPHFQSLYWLHQREKEEWQVCKTSNLAVAMLRTHEASFPLQPPDYQGWHRDGAAGLFLGTHPNVTELVQEPVLPTIAAFAHHRYFAPSKRFLTWLARHDFSIMYFYSLEFDMAKLVVISSRQLRLDISAQEIL